MLGKLSVDSLHKMSKPIFLKKKENYTKILFAEILPSMQNVNIYLEFWAQLFKALLALRAR